MALWLCRNIAEGKPWELRKEVFLFVEFLAMGTGKSSEECTQDIFGCWEVPFEMMTILFFLDSCL